MASRLTFSSIPSFLEKNRVITTTVQEVFKSLKANYQNFNKVTDEDLIALASIFGDTCEKALEIVEENKVTYYHTNSNEVGIYQVEGSSNRTYTIFPGVNYCSCHSYKYQVAGGSQITCKHVLATVIADATDQKRSISVFKMNEREDWRNGNPYMEQYMYPVPGTSPFGVGPSNWVHVPPQTMPWGLPPQSHPQVVRFTAGGFSSPPSSIKRKCELSLDTPPAKMLVTEEKMAAHMKSLHISEVETPEVMTNLNCKEESMETDKLPRLVVCDEIKNIKTEPILPESILKSLQKPEMALVLWQPPAADLGSKLKELRRLSKSKAQDKEKEKENKEKAEKEMDVVMETETEMETEVEAEAKNNNIGSVFRPIDPVPMPTVQNRYFQPVPQFQCYSPFS